MGNDLYQAAAPAPPGEHTNLIDPPSQSYLIIITGVVCISCVLPMVGIRLYVSTCVLKSPKWDDLLVFLAAILLLFYGSVGLAMCAHRAFVDIWNIPLIELTQLLRLIYIAQVTYSILILAIKVSILILYKRIFVPSQMRRQWVNYTIMTVIWFNVSFYIANFCAQAFACIPVAKIWDRSISGFCVNDRALITSAAIINVASDFLIFIIPVVVISKLYVSHKRKVELYVIFMCGFLCFIFSVIRLIYSILSISDTNQPLGLLKVGLWTVGEIGSCFLATCVPMVPRLRRHLQGKPRGSINSLALPVESETSRPTRQYPKPSTTLFSAADRGLKDEEDPYLMIRDEEIAPNRATRLISDAFDPMLGEMHET